MKSSLASTETVTHTPPWCYLATRMPGNGLTPSHWISKRRHWRLVVMTKEGCTPAEVTLRDTQNSLCAHWREKAKARIARLHPALVIVSWARWMEPWRARRPECQRATAARGKTERQRSFSSYGARRSRSSSSPTRPISHQSAPDCVAGHLSDVRPCTTKRSDSTVLPAIKAAELRIAKQEQINSIDPAHGSAHRRSAQ